MCKYVYRSYVVFIGTLLDGIGGKKISNKRWEILFNPSFHQLCVIYFIQINREVPIIITYRFKASDTPL